MTRQLPPYPIGDLRQWATELVEYLQNRDSVESEVIAKPVAFSHRLTDERAFDDGLVMYNPTINRLEVTVDDEWTPIAHDIAEVFQTVVTTMVLTDGWQSVPVTTTIGDMPPGVYQVTINLRVTGTGGNAEYQLRLVQDGVPAATSAETEVGNGDTIYVPITFMATTADGTIVLEARGNSVTIESGTLTLVRLGQP